MPLENHLAKKGKFVVLPYQDLLNLTGNGTISVSDAGSQVRPASVDLLLGDVAYRVSGSFLPGVNTSVEECLNRVILYELSLKGKGAVLEPNGTYLIPLREDFVLDERYILRGSTKSSAGRLDILARLVGDNQVFFDCVDGGYKGKVYLEVTPGSFYVRVREGVSLYQVRVLRECDEPCVYRENLLLRVDLEGKDGTPVAYRSRKAFSAFSREDTLFPRVIDYSKRNFYSMEDFWEPVFVNGFGQVALEPNSFYVMKSLDRVEVPLSCVAEMYPYHAQAGEFRVHYAGFFDPGFRAGSTVLEVRSHSVPYLLSHGSIMGEVFHTPLLRQTEKGYENVDSSYKRQGLTLSNHFRLLI